MVVVGSYLLIVNLKRLLIYRIIELDEPPLFLSIAGVFLFVQGLILVFSSVNNTLLRKATSSTLIIVLINVILLGALDILRTLDPSTDLLFFALLYLTVCVPVTLLLLLISTVLSVWSLFYKKGNIQNLEV